MCMALLCMQGLEAETLRLRKALAETEGIRKSEKASSNELEMAAAKVKNLKSQRSNQLAVCIVLMIALTF